MGYPDLGIATMQEYSNMYYAQIVEQNNETGAFELSVNKTTGVVTPMQGPTMMWDTKYGVTESGIMGYLTSSGAANGMMGSGGMMTWLRGTPTTNMAISMQQAKTIAHNRRTNNHILRILPNASPKRRQTSRNDGHLRNHRTSHILHMDGNLHATESLRLKPKPPFS
jgi:hypothetical protein